MKTSVRFPMLFLSIFMLSLACALFGVALGLVFPDMPLWLLMPMLLLISLALAGGTGSLLYRLHRRKLSAISEDTRFKDAILRFVRESSNLKTREALYNLILETAVAAIPHATAGSLLKVIEAPSTGDEPPGENTEGENTPSENTPGESSPGESSPDENAPDGGDEFVAVFLNRSTEDLQETMRDIVADLKRHPLLVGINAVVIQFSFGMVAFHQAFHDHQQIMHASDAFMYECKREHREMYA